MDGKGEKKCPMLNRTNATSNHSKICLPMSTISLCPWKVESILYLSYLFHAEERQKALCDVTKWTDTQDSQGAGRTSSQLLALPRVTNLFLFVFLFHSKHVSKSTSPSKHWFWQEAVNRGINIWFSGGPPRCMLVSCDDSCVTAPLWFWG